MACDLTASLHRVVFATSPFTAQAAMDIYDPTPTVAAVMQPNWHGSERHLHKRAPIGEGEWTRPVVKHSADHCMAEEVDLEKRHIFRVGKYHPSERVPEDIAQAPPPKLKELYRIGRNSKGDKVKEHIAHFQASRHRPPCLRR